MSTHIEASGRVRELKATAAVALTKDSHLVELRDADDRDVLLLVEVERNVPWLLNRSAEHAAAVYDGNGVVMARLAPHTSVPLVFRRNIVRLPGHASGVIMAVANTNPVFEHVHHRHDHGVDLSRVSLTYDQRLLLVALAEKRLTGGATHLPSSAEAAARLGWSITRFNRKLDNVCHKFERLGIEGLHGDRDSLATHRRLRLVEWVLGSGLVTTADLELIDPGPGDQATHGS